MTTTGPRPPDVAFDHAAAAAALGALDRASAVLADVGTARNTAAATARQHFRGVYADDLATADHDLGNTSADARSAVAALRSAIAAAADTARRAQAARHTEQQAWDAADAAAGVLPARVA